MQEDTAVVSLNIPESVMFTDYVKRLKNNGGFHTEIIFHFDNLRRARARIKHFE